MADSVDLSGNRMDITVRQGDSFYFADTISILVNGVPTPVTPTAARIVFRNGTLASPGSVVSGVTGAISISSNIVTWGIANDAYTRLFLIGTDGTPNNYIYSYEVDLPSPYSVTQTVSFGIYTPAPEIS